VLSDLLLPVLHHFLHVLHPSRLAPQQLLHPGPLSTPPLQHGLQLGLLQRSTTAVLPQAGRLLVLASAGQGLCGQVLQLLSYPEVLVVEVVLIELI
jgi:hypothetical protein